MASPMPIGFVSLTEYASMVGGHVLLGATTPTALTGVALMSIGLVMSIMD